MTRKEEVSEISTKLWSFGWQLMTWRAPRRFRWHSNHSCHLTYYDTGLVVEKAGWVRNHLFFSWILLAGSWISMRMNDGQGEICGASRLNLAPFFPGDKNGKADQRSSSCGEVLVCPLSMWLCPRTFADMEAILLILRYNHIMQLFTSGSLWNVESDWKI